MKTINEVLKKVTGNHVLLAIIGVLMTWQGIDNRIAISITKDAVEVAQEARISYLKATFAAENIQAAVENNKEVVIDSIDALRNEIIALFQVRADTVDQVYQGVLLPLVNQVDVNTAEISILKSKESARCKREILTTMQVSGLK